MTIHEMVAKIEEEIRDNKEREAAACASIQRIIDRGQAEGRTTMTQAEDARSEAMFADIERLRAARKRLNAKLAEARKVQAEEDENDRLMSLPGKVLVRHPNGDHEYRMGVTADQAVIRTAESPEWIRSADGRTATVSRDMRFSDHEVVRGEIARNSERDRHIVETHGGFGSYLRAMTTTGASAIVPMDWSSAIIDKARNASVMMQAGCQMVPMDAKTVQIARLTTDPTVAFKTEGSAVNASDMAYDYIQLVATSMTALVVVSYEFLMDAVNAESQITGALGNAMALELDKAIIFGQLGTTGTNDEGSAYGLASPYPKGILKNLIDNAAANIIGSFPTNGTAQTAATPWTEMLALVYKPLRGNEKCTAIVSNVALEQQYAGMVDTQYNPIRKPEIIAGLPWLKTNAIPSYTRGSMTSRATDVFAGDFSQVLVGQRLGLEIRVLTERYAENGQVGLLAYWRGDVNVARPGALACYRALQGAA
jgi:HK97 family phage major capsid protein